MYLLKRQIVAKRLSCPCPEHRIGKEVSSSQSERRDKHWNEKCSLWDGQKEAIFGGLIREEACVDITLPASDKAAENASFCPSHKEALLGSMACLGGSDWR